MRILLVEDEPTLREQLRAGLAQAGYVVEQADNGRDAHFLGESEVFDAVVLDLGLPRMDGLTVLKRWRDQGHSMPVLILTARDNWHDKVAKPFHMEELLARVRALIRRAHGVASAVLRQGDVALDTRSGRVTALGQTVSLTSHEYKVLDYLMHRPEAVVSRSELTAHIYAQDFDRDSNTIEVFVGRLRKKLPTLNIETVRGLGYRLVQAQQGAR
jgi:two-component system OmpR family response regulator